MENEIKIETDINAPAEVVWDILTDFGSYPQWNPLIPKCETSLFAGAHVSFTLRVNGIDLPVIGAQITNVTKNQDFRWVGPSLEFLQPVIRLEHYFSIVPKGTDKCTFIHGEFGQGLLGPVAYQLLSFAESGYSDMNYALKSRAEDRVRQAKAS